MVLVHTVVYRFVEPVCAKIYGEVWWIRYIKQRKVVLNVFANNHKVKTYSKILLIARPILSSNQEEYIKVTQFSQKSSHSIILI